LHVPKSLVDALLMEKRSGEPLELRVFKALLEHLYGAR